MKVIWLIETCYNKAVVISKQGNDSLKHFLLRIVWKKNMFIIIAFKLCFRICLYEGQCKQKELKPSFWITPIVLIDWAKNLKSFISHY